MWIFGDDDRGARRRPDPVAVAWRQMEGEAQRELDRALDRAVEILAQKTESARLKIGGLSDETTARVTELREETRRLTQKVGQLERSFADHGTALRTLSEMMAEHAAFLDRQAARQDKQDESLAQTAATLTRYVETVDTLRARLISENRSLTDADFLVQYQIGERLKRLFSQRLPDLTNVRTGPGQESADGTDALMREARQVRLMCEVLFEGDEPDPDRLATIVTDSGQIALSESDSRLLERVKREAVNLRQAIEDAGHPYIFIFELPAGTVADSAQHELWTSATAGEPVAFVVTPGYVVSGRRVLPPAVITERGEPN